MGVWNQPFQGGGGIEQPVKSGSSGWDVAAGIADLFTSGPTPRAPTEDEKYDAYWSNFTSQLKDPTRHKISPLEASREEHDAFIRLHPSLAPKTRSILESANSNLSYVPDLAESALNAFSNTPVGQKAILTATTLYPDDPDARRTYIEGEALKANQNALELEELKLSKARTEDLERFRGEVWTSGVANSGLQVYADTLTLSVTNLVEAIQVSETSQIEMSSIPQLQAYLPGVNVINKDNLGMVIKTLKGSILSNFSRELSDKLGRDVGIPSAEQIGPAFQALDDLVAWAEAEVSFEVIEERLAARGRILSKDYLTPEQTWILSYMMPQIKGAAPEVTEGLMSGIGAWASAVKAIFPTLEKGEVLDTAGAWGELEKMSSGDLAQAAVGFAIMGQSLSGGVLESVEGNVNVSAGAIQLYESVDSRTKDLIAANSALGVFAAHEIGAKREGQEGIISLDVYKEVLAGNGEAIRRYKTDMPGSANDFSVRMTDALVLDITREHTNLLNSIPKRAYGTEGESAVEKRTHDVVLRDNKLVVVPTQETQAEIEELQGLIERGRAGELTGDYATNYRSGRYNDQLDEILGDASGIDLTELNGKITIIRDLGMAEGDLGYQVLQTFGAKPEVFDRMPEQVGAEATQLIADREAGIISAGTADVLEHGAYTPPPDVAADAGFMSAVEATANNIGFPSNWLLRAIGFETAGSFDPAVKNPNSTATGLIQFMESTAKGLGTSTAELAQMTAEEQMSWVNKYLLPYKGKIKNFGDLYMAIHYPIAVGRPDEYVLYRDDGTTTSEYAVNKTLDSNGDGTVTRGEAVANAFARAGGGRGGLGTTAYTQAGAEDIAGAPLPPTSGGESGFIASGPLGAPAPQTFAPETSPRPEARPESVEAGVFTGKGGESAPMPTPETDPSVLQLVENTTGKTRAWFDEQGLPPNTPIYSSMEAAEKAADEGRLPKGARVAVVDSNGVMQVVEVE